VIRALLIGVSDYSAIGATGLPFCQNDILAVKKALITGLNATAENILICGKSGIVLQEELWGAIDRLARLSEGEDVVFFYFSGHGAFNRSEHFLVMSDGPVPTQTVIEKVDAINAKSKIMVLDTCMAGSFKLDMENDKLFDRTIKSSASKGLAILASCSCEQLSRFSLERPISLFTEFFCSAVENNTLTRRGRKTWHDIQQLTSLYLHNWSSRHTSIEQTPIFRSCMIGTIYFDVADYIPYYRGAIFEENADYVIYSAEPSHSSIAKRYSVKVILKRPCTFEDVAKINLEIVKKAQKFELYSTQGQEAKWKGRKVDLVFCFCGYSEQDVENANWYCRTTWADSDQDKSHWYKCGKYDEIISGIKFCANPHYDYFVAFNMEHTIDREDLWEQTNNIISKIVVSAEKVIGLFNEYQNGTFSEEDFIRHSSSSMKAIEEGFWAEGSLELPPTELHEWSCACSGLVGTIHDFTLFYNSKSMTSRTQANRDQCMKLHIKQYYSDLEKVRILEEKLRGL